MADVTVTIEDFYQAIGKLYFSLSQEEKKSARAEQDRATADLGRQEAEKCTQGISEEYLKLRAKEDFLTAELASLRGAYSDLQRENEKMKDEIRTPRSRKK